MFWVGGRKAAEDGKLRWLNGSQIDLDRFRWAGNKDRMTREEFQYVAMGGNGALLLENDKGFDRYAAFICEWPRQP